MYCDQKKVIQMKTQDEGILRDIKLIYALSSRFDLSDQRAVDNLYKQIKRQSQSPFRSWVGRAFYQTLEKRTSYAKRRRHVAFCFKQVEIVIFITAFFMLGIGVAYKMKENEGKILQEALWEIRDERTVERAGNVQESTEEIALEEITNSEILEEYQQFYDVNPDFVGWIRIAGTSVDCPVLQNRENPEFYLSHNFLKEEQRSGSVFLDGLANTAPMDDNVILYGHNMKDGTVFGSLKKYKDKEFYQEHPEFEFDTCYEKALYEIVAVVITDISEEKDFYYFEFSNYDEDSFQKCKEFIEEEQLYETGRQAEYGDKLVMLSTCEGSSKNSRLIVIGRRTNRL